METMFDYDIEIDNDKKYFTWGTFSFNAKKNLELSFKKIRINLRYFYDF